MVYFIKFSKFQLYKMVQFGEISISGGFQEVIYLPNMINDSFLKIGGYMDLKKKQNELNNQ